MPEQATMAKSSKNRRNQQSFGLTGGWLTFWITVACATDMTLFGYDQAVFSGVIVTQDFLDVHGLAASNSHNTEIISTLSAVYSLGCFVGAIVAFTLGERIGRKKTILVGTFIMAVGALLQTTSYSVPQMFVGRVVAGIGNGLNTATAPVTSKPEWRGKLVLLEMWTNIAGFTLVNWINYGFSYAKGSVAWRFPLAFQFFFIIILFATVPWLPESPRWLIAHERVNEAIPIIAALEEKDSGDVVIIKTLQDIQYSVSYELEHSIPWKDLLRGKKGDGHDTKTLRRLLLGAGTQFMQQFGGINIMSYYLPPVFIQVIGLPDKLARLLVAVNALTYLIFSGAAVPLVERWGRRGLMLLSTVGQQLAFLAITIILRFVDISANSAELGKAAIVFFFLYYISFGLGMLGVPWLYPTEINSLPLRTKGAAVATCTNWITNFIIVEITPIGLNNLGWKFWIVWTLTNTAFLPIIYFLYPETANRTLEDLDFYYRSNPSLIVTTNRAVTSSKRPQEYINREQEEMAEIRRRGSVHEAYNKDAANQ
ncbi:general substrate transporter [Xylaria grammica]|nr:general substrate transporter [Xylaria grammica]